MINSWLACVRRGPAPSLPATRSPCPLAVRLALTGCASRQDRRLSDGTGRDTPHAVARTQILNDQPARQSWPCTPRDPTTDGQLCGSCTRPTTRGSDTGGMIPRLRRGPVASSSGFDRRLLAPIILGA